MSYTLGNIVFLLPVFVHEILEKNVCVIDFYEEKLYKVLARVARLLV